MTKMISDAVVAPTETAVAGWVGLGVSLAPVTTRRIDDLVSSGSMTTTLTTSRRLHLGFAFLLELTRLPVLETWKTEVTVGV